MRNFGAEMWLAIGFGFVAGLATLWTFGRWVSFVGRLRQDSFLADERQKPQHRIIGFPVLGFAQPTPWLVIIGLPYAAYYLRARAPVPRWRLVFWNNWRCSRVLACWRGRAEV